MDVKLPVHRHLMMRVHLLYCVWCRRYTVQLQFLRRATRELPPETFAAPLHKLSCEEKEQIRTRLQEELERFKK
ncbi:MAG TPA: hypothetical protein VH280_22050 [Verrucomicrobiae bacterium]|jgi:hypothetical protein|nr:hypothetical protein [Verrucomicrobiae bacterium]